MVRSLARAHRYDDIARLLADHPLFRLPGGDGRAALDAILADYRARDAGISQPSQDWSATLPDALPILFLYGERDSPARIAAGRRLQRRHANARLAIVDGAGHLANLCSPAAFNAALASSSPRSNRVDSNRLHSPRADDIGSLFEWKFG